VCDDDVLLELFDDVVALDDDPEEPDDTAVLDRSSSSEDVLAWLVVLFVVLAALVDVRPALAAIAPVRPTKVARLTAPVMRRARRAGCARRGRGPWDDWFDGVVVMAGSCARPGKGSRDRRESSVRTGTQGASTRSIRWSTSVRPRSTSLRCVHVVVPTNSRRT
jgi:hypothetical protein